MRLIPPLLLAVVLLGGLSQCAFRASIGQQYYNSQQQTQQSMQWMQQQNQAMEQQNQQMLQQMMNDMNQMNQMSGGFPMTMPQGYPPQGYPAQGYSSQGYTTNGGFRHNEPQPQY